MTPGPRSCPAAGSGPGRGIYILAITAVTLAGTAMAQSVDRAAGGVAEKIRAFVTIPPQAYFVERVGGEHVEVEVLIGPGQSPHAYEPTPKQIARLAEAQVYFQIGVPFEETLVKKIAATCKRLQMVDTGKGIKLRVMEGHDEEHAGQPGGGAGQPDHEHEAGALDPHTWLDPKLAKIQADNICEALRRIDPAHAADYRNNVAAFHNDLDQLDAKIAETLTPLKGKEFFVFHPAFGYFADAYGLKQVPVEIEGKEPSAKQLAELIERARRSGVKVIFVQPQFSTKNAEAVAKAIGGAVVPMDNLARDYLKNLEEMAQRLKEALAGGGN